MAYDYNLGNKQFQEQQRQARAKEAEQQQRDQAQEARDSFKNSLAEQGERLKAANDAFTTAYKMHQDQKQEQALQHAALFMQGYNLIPENAPNRKEQLNWLMSKLPEAMKVPEIQKMLAADNARLNPKPEITAQDAKFLKDNGPGSKNYAALQKSAGNPDAPDHVESAIQYGRVWDLLKKGQGLPTGTPEGTDIPGYVKGIESTFAKLPNGQPNPAYQPPAGEVPPPSTPAPANAAAWSNATVPDVARLPGSTQPLAAPPATGTPAATAPTSQDAKTFLNGLFPKTSDAGAASSAASDRNELNDMMNQSPETQFAAPKQPTPPPTPTPAPKDQYYTA
jgi:hypothetical protein